MVLALFFNACNPARKLKQGEYLLNKNYVIDKDTKIDKSDIETYIKQKPNRKIFVAFRFHLWLHNLVNEDRVKRKRILFEKKIEKRNKRRVNKGKKEKKNNRQLLGEWLLNISEPPVIYDSLLSEKSAKQIKLFLNNKGYFISTAKDSVHYKRRKKVDVYYKINASEPYTINKLDYKIPDELVKYYVLSDTSNTLIKRTSNYDVDVLQQERERIANELNNNGYYLFTKDYIYYAIDTNIGNKKVNVTLGIKNFVRKYSDNSDSIIETPHQRFYVNKIFIQPDFISKKMDGTPKDTTVAEDYYILHTQKLRYKTRVLLNSVFIRKGLYQLKDVDDTYKRLSDLKAFKTINIFFVPDKGDYLNCYIQLSPILKQSFTIETEVKNTSGNPGIGGSIVYQNRNLFKGAEVLELRLKVGVEAQKIFNDKAINSGIGDPVKQFNTVEIGPEGNIYIPRFLIPFKKIKPSKNSNPRTIFTSSFIYQGRPQYYRYIANLSFSYTWKETATKRHTVTPLMLNSVKVNLQPAFSQYLTESVHDLYVINSFSNHLSTTTRYSFSYNEQEIKKLGSFSFFKFNAESSGNILRGMYDMINSFHPNTFIKNSKGEYQLFDVIYSQYLRTDADYRYYYNVNEISKIVFRIAAGIGKPLKNFPQLPFERSFYSGGANGIRAWQSHTLGPGSYADDGLFSFDQFGDGQLEGNIEYRFNIFKMLNGAVFMDGGNTWLRVPAANRPGGDFQLDRFYKEIAVGSGIGLRFDFNFFIIRFDLGLKVRDPQFSESKRWVINNLFNPEWKNNYRLTHNNSKYGFFAFNIGIGYPF
jgi:outer membrane protein assembly factor BamA